MKTYDVDPAKFDGAAFAQRYGLASESGDFWIAPGTQGWLLCLRDGIVLPDDPPVFEPPPARRRPRTILAIAADLNALTTAKKNAVWTDITSGSPPKWSTNTGPNASAIAVLQLLATSGISSADVLAAKVRGVAMYVQDNPNYLVNPSFDPTINVPGDEVIP